MEIFWFLILIIVCNNSQGLNSHFVPDTLYLKIHIILSSNPLLFLLKEKETQKMKFIAQCLTIMAGGTRFGITVRLTTWVVKSEFRDPSSHRPLQGPGRCPRCVFTRQCGQLPSLPGTKVFIGVQGLPCYNWDCSGKLARLAILL